MERCGDRQDTAKKKVKKTERELTSALFLLRCFQMGLSIADLDYLNVGTIYDMMVESGNDGYEYADIATQEDMDNF